MKLNTTTEMVKGILERCPDARNSDNRLYYEVLKQKGKEKGVDLKGTPIGIFLLNMKDYGLPSIETVGRCRRKVIECHPELAGTDAVEAQRTLNEAEFRDYARQVNV